ncbi:type II toxin-antitoxin system VapC family toxin [Candidatus Poribacteria bacterium]|nr:type II toxin-antitoxin system VapC family toxin [Candidatus Poribacteria bacterium]
MAVYYHDTSALVKHYHTEVGTPIVDHLLAEPNSSHFLSRLSGVELESALAKNVRMNLISVTDFQNYRVKFRTDITNSRFQILRLLVRHLQRAETLIRQHALAQSLRTLDAIQLAVALDLHQNHGLDYFVCADTNLCQIAEAEGLAVINPVTHTP